MSLSVRSLVLSLKIRVEADFTLTGVLSETSLSG